MKGFVSSIINILFFPFIIIKRMFGFLGEPLKFINEQRRLENHHKLQRAKFYSQKRKLYKDNDEII